MLRKISSLLLAIVLLNFVPALTAGASPNRQDTPTIVSFTTTADRVDRTALETDIARVPVAWEVVNRPINANLVFDQLLPDGSFVNVELPRENPWVASSGEGIAAPVLPAEDATEIELRLRLFDTETNDIYDEETLIIPIGPSGGSTPRIVSFTTGIDQVSQTMLDAGTARVPVAWESLNRPNTATLVFEQVLADGTVVNVEYPRENPWVSPTGTGAVNPVPSTDAQQIQLQIRMVDLVTDQVYDTRYAYLTITDDETTAEIVYFQSSTIALTRDTLADGSARVPVTWEVVNRPANSNLIFEQVLTDGTVVNVELPRDFVLVPSAGNGIMAPQLPGGNAQTALLRMRLIDMSTRYEYDKATLRLPIEGGAPRVTKFTTSVTGLYPGNFGTEAGRVPISWSVVNRPDNSNLVFEQRLPGDQVVNVELPRSNPWVPSVGNGIVAPVYPGTAAESVTFQMRLVNLNTDETITLAEINLPIVRNEQGQDDDTSTTYENIVEVTGDACYETPFEPSQGVAVGMTVRAETGLTIREGPYSRVPVDGFLGEQVEILEGPVCFYYTTTNGRSDYLRMWRVQGVDRSIIGWAREYTATSTETYYHLHQIAEDEIAIDSFTADKETVGASESITFTWQTTNAPQVMLRAELPAEHTNDIIVNELPPSGSYTMTMPAYIGGDAAGTFYLHARDPDDSLRQATTSLEITLTCDNVFFFGESGDCVVEPAESAEAAYQTFENGALIWHGPTRSVYMLLDDETGARFVETWDGTSEITWSESPPDGLLLPERGFGWLWTNTAAVRDALGWATSPEQGYTMQIQRGIVPNNPQEQYVLYFTTPDGRTVRYIENGENSTWTAVQ